MQNSPKFVRAVKKRKRNVFYIIQQTSKQFTTNNCITAELCKLKQFKRLSTTVAGDINEPWNFERKLKKFERKFNPLKNLRGTFQRKFPHNSCKCWICKGKLPHNKTYEISCSNSMQTATIYKPTVLRKVASDSLLIRQSKLFREM